MIIIVRRMRGEVAVLAAALGSGVGTALSVVTLRGLRPANLLAVELGGSALVRLAGGRRDRPA